LEVFAVDCFVVTCTSAADGAYEVKWWQIRNGDLPDLRKLYQHGTFVSSAHRSRRRVRPVVFSRHFSKNALHLIVKASARRGKNRRRACLGQHLSTTVNFSPHVVTALRLGRVYAPACAPFDGPWVPGPLFSFGCNETTASPAAAVLCA
jgi:hypothetical protein